MQVWTIVAGQTVVIAGQVVADCGAHVRGVTVLDLGEHGQPELRALIADAGSDAEHVTAAIGGDAMTTWKGRLVTWTSRTSTRMASTKITG